MFEQLLSGQLKPTDLTREQALTLLSEALIRIANDAESGERRSFPFGEPSHPKNGNFTDNVLTR